MPEVGEEIVGTWLRYCARCDFLDYHVSVRDGQGEIDVVGINSDERRAYICEVATHTRGLGYKDNRRSILGKFERARGYAKKYLKNFTHTYMFWAPVVRSGSQMRTVDDISEVLRSRYDIELELVINKDFLSRLDQLRALAAGKTRNSPHSVFRFLQIEEQARKLRA